MATTPPPALIDPPQVRVTEYSVSMLPEDVPDASHWTIRVQYRGGGKWAVSDGFRLYDRDGRPEPEPLPSEDDWLDRFQHSEADALALAERLARTVRVGVYRAASLMTAAEYLAWREARVAAALRVVRGGRG